LTYLKRPYFVTMATYLLSIILPFNNSLSLSLKELMESSQLQRKDLLKQVQLLIDSKLINVDVCIHPNHHLSYFLVLLETPPFFLYIPCLTPFPPPIHFCIYFPLLTPLLSVFAYSPRFVSISHLCIYFPNRSTIFVSTLCIYSPLHPCLM